MLNEKYFQLIDCPTPRPEFPLFAYLCVQTAAKKREKKLNNRMCHWVGVCVFTVQYALGAQSMK